MYFLPFVLHTHDYLVIFLSSIWSEFYFINIILLLVWLFVHSYISTNINKNVQNCSVMDGEITAHRTQSLHYEIIKIWESSLYPCNPLIISCFGVFGITAILYPYKYIFQNHSTIIVEHTWQNTGFANEMGWF